MILVGCVGDFFFAHGFGDTFELDQTHGTALYEHFLKFLHRVVVRFFCALVLAGLNQGGELFIRLPLGWVPYTPALHTDGIAPFQQLLIPVSGFPKRTLDGGGSYTIPNQLRIIPAVVNEDLVLRFLPVLVDEKFILPGTDTSC